MAAGADWSAGADRRHDEPRRAPRLGDTRGGARSRRAAARFAHVPLDARREPDLRNDISRLPDLRVPGAALHVEQPRVRVDHLDAPGPPHEQSDHVAARDSHRARLLPVAAGRRASLPRRAARRRLLVLHHRDVDPAVCGGLSRAEAPLTTAKPPAHRIEREDVVLWLLAFTPVLAWIVAQGFSFLATRSICEPGVRWVLDLLMGSGLVATAAAGATSWTKWKRFADGSPAYRRFLAIGSVMLAAICAVSILSLMIAAAIHRPCD